MLNRPATYDLTPRKRRPDAELKKIRLERERALRRKSLIRFWAIVLGLMVLLSALGLMSGCSEAEVGKYAALGSEHHITLYSGGIVVRTWVSTGKVETERNSDGYYFIDKATRKLVRVTGDLVVEVIE